MTDEEKKRAVRKQLEAFNHHNEDEYAAEFTASCKVIDIPTGDTLAGKDGAREFFRRWSNAFPDGKTTIHDELVSEDTVVVLFTGEGTQKGPLGPFPPSNKRAKLEFATITKLDANGKAEVSTTYYDQLSLLMQLGYVPMPTGAGAPR